MTSNLLISTVEMHTGGEPLRIVKSGYPVIPGENILKKRNFVMNQLDYIRKFLVFEPRGHHDMYAALPVETDEKEADVAVLFMDNKGYGAMCGHAVIALGRYFVDQNIVKYQEPETSINIQCPCGLVRAFVKCANGKTGSVRFLSIQAFALNLDFHLSTPTYGNLKIDISYGGAFYGILPLSSIGLSIDSQLNLITAAAREIKECLIKQTKFTHPYSSDLSFLYGIIFTQDDEGNSDSSSFFNLVIFADASFDRSPCGSGSTARLAALFAKKKVSLKQKVSFVNPITKSFFQAQVVEVGKFADHDSIVAEISGNAHYTGTATFTQEDEDSLKDGFKIY